jgi:oligoribonuclease NrnB/cAMP/cGMP phosphodiesterase (DHH superfamily)
MKNIDFKNIDTIFHISDKDLDGYGSQMLLKEYLKNNNIKSKIKFFNPQRENILSDINYVFSEIVKDKKQKYLLLLTDLSLEEEHIKKMNNFKRGNKNISVEYQLLDHHISGEKNIINEWYHLDLNNCSAKITYLFLEKNLGKNENLEKIADLIQVKDLWIKGSKNFNKSTFLSDNLMNIRYPEIFKDNERNEKLYLIKNLGKLLLSDLSLKDIEKEFIDLKNNYYNKYIGAELSKNDDLSSELRKQYYFYTLFLKITNNFKIIKIDDYKMKVLYGIEPHIFQILSSLYLENNTDIDIMMNLSSNGKLSLRCNQDLEKINLSDISTKYFNGGGHAKAAGGKIELKDNIYSQNTIEKLIKDIILSKKDIEVQFDDIEVQF